MKIIDWAEIDRLRNSLATPRLQVQQAEDDEVKLIEYDFGKYGSSEMRQHLLGRWSSEVKTLPR